VCRYVERNALRASLCALAKEWQWSSLYHRLWKNEFAAQVLSEWPVSRPRLWPSHLQQPQSEAELAALRRSVACGSPGDSQWIEHVAKQLDIEITLRPQDRPRKQEEKVS